MARSRQPTEHLTRPQTLQTNGMVERFNGRLSQVLRSHHVNSAGSGKTLHRLVWLNKQHLPQKALGHETADSAVIGLLALCCVRTARWAGRRG